MQAKNQYLEKMKCELDEFKTAIAEYEYSVCLTHGDALIIYEDNLFTLEQQCALIRDKIEQIEASDENEWDEFSMETDHLRCVFTESFKTFKTQR